MELLVIGTGLKMSLRNSLINQCSTLETSQV